LTADVAAIQETTLMLDQSLAHAPVRPRWGRTLSSESAESALFSGHPELIITKFTYGRGERIFGEGETAEYVYQVLCGAVRSFRLLSDGRRQIGAFRLAGDAFGLESGLNHHATAEAVIETTVRIVKHRSLELAANGDAAVACELWAMTAGELRGAEDHMALLGRNSATQRVAAFLLEMDRRLADADRFTLPMPRCDIADYLGLRLETVSRVVSQLQAKGVVALAGRRQIQLCDRARLAEMVA
jgi:CRP/FNR family nitrogen fixation transcriptional regulator